MPYDFRNLDPVTRRYMLEELALDQRARRVYLSDRLTPEGRAAYPELLRRALAEGDEQSLARALPMSLFNASESRVRRGTPYTARLGANAPTTLANDQFNRYYIRGVCARAIAERGPEATVTVYRARPTAQPRPESERKVGHAFSARELLADLRSHMESTTLGVPSGPASGLSVALPPGV